MKAKKQTAKPSEGTWIVEPDIGTGNTYTLFGKATDGTPFLRDSDPDVMDANAKLMSAAPELASLLIAARAHVPKNQNTLRLRINEALKKAGV